MSRMSLASCVAFGRGSIMHLSSSTMVFVLMLAAGGAAACENNNTVVPTTPAAPTTTDTFNGTVTVNGAVTHVFSSTQRGTVSATLTTMDPDASQTVGVSLGTWNGSSCQIILANDQATVGAGVLGTVSGVGNLCLRIYDVGKLNRPENYSVQVSHP
jgi:hypothetical protein